MRRFRFGDLCSSMWLEYARRPRSLPVPVLRNRFLVPEWVFIFGIGPIIQADACEAASASSFAGAGGACRARSREGAMSMLMFLPS